MKKNIYYLFALIALFTCSTTLFSACGDDEDSPSGDALIERLQGTWFFDKAKLNIMGQTIEMNADEIRNGSGYENFYDESLSFSGTKVNGQTYKVDGNRVMLPWYTNLDWWAKVSFSKSQLIFEYDITQNGVNFKMWCYYNSVSRAGSTTFSSDTDPSLLPVLLQINSYTAE